LSTDCQTGPGDGSVEAVGEQPAGGPPRERERAGGPRPPGARRPASTIYDVAALAGVSPSAVSRALNKPGRINARTEQRIREAAATLGYRCNPIARALPTGRTSILALVLSDITNPVYFDLLRGVERVTAGLGYTLVVADARESAAVEWDTVQRLAAWVDGFVLAASRLRDARIRELAGRRPVVLVNRALTGVPGVVPDAGPGVRDAVDHLGSLGHRAIGYLAGPAASYMNRIRRRSLAEHATARGVAVVEIGSGQPTVEGGRAAAGRVLGEGVPAVVAYNDLMAMGLVAACRERGVDVPGRLSVVGFDDIFGADLMTPALSTVASPLGDGGGEAGRRLVAAVEGRPEPAVAPLATRFVARGSTGPAGSP
jgi:LacI family transcriptional regulator